MLHSLIGQAKHEIEVKRGKASGPRITHSLRDFIRGVNTSKGFEQVGIEALSAHAQAVETSGAQTYQLVSAERARVSFQRNLRISVNCKRAATGIEQAGHLGNTEQAGRATTKKDG